MNKQDFMKSNNEIDYVAYISYLESEKNQLTKYLENKRIRRKNKGNSRMKYIEYWISILKEQLNQLLNII